MFLYGKSSKPISKHNKQIISEEKHFDTAAELLRQPNPNLKQTKLCVMNNKLKYDCYALEMSSKSKHNNRFDYMPIPNKDSPTTSLQSIDKEKENKLSVATNDSLTVNPMRNQISLIGRIQFCLKIHKLYPDLNIIWNVYGKLLRNILGKNSEQTLLLRDDNQGPILQSIFYNFDGQTKQFPIGCYVFVIGRFIGENRLKTFHVEQVSAETWHEKFSRAENITSFILMQSKIEKKNI